MDGEVIKSTSIGSTFHITCDNVANKRKESNQRKLIVSFICPEILKISKINKTAQTSGYPLFFQVGKSGLHIFWWRAPQIKPWNMVVILVCMSGWYFSPVWFGDLLKRLPSSSYVFTVLMFLLRCDIWQKIKALLKLIFATQNCVAISVTIFRDRQRWPKVL